MWPRLTPSMTHFAALLVALQLSPAAQLTVIHAGRLIDPVTGRVSHDQVIVVDSGRIVSVGARAAEQRDARTIDLRAYTVLPGLIDAHVHLGIGGSVRDNALADLRAGFTTVLDLGARSTRLLRIRDSINAGLIPGPRVLAAGIWIGVQNGVCEFGGIGIADGAEAFRSRVRENVAAGADVIKLCVTGWPADAYARPSEYEIGDDVMRAVVDEANAVGRPVIAHGISTGGVLAAVRSGVHGLAHAAFLDASTARALRDRRVFMIPTLASLTVNDSSAASRALISSTALAFHDGVTLVFGTDAGVLPHGRQADEFVALRRAGIPAIDVLRAATINAARALGIADSVGTIAPNMAADIIAVEGDPLSDMTSLGRTRFVMSRGVVRRWP